MSQSVSHVLGNPQVPTSTALPQTNNLIYTDWVAIQRGFDPNQLHARETVFTIGNGYLGTRGSFEEGYPHSMPATLIHGVYDAVPVMYTELVNCPDWLPLTITLNGEPTSRQVEQFRLNRGEVLSYERRLDLRSGLLRRSVRWRSPSGKTLDLQFERFASLADPHILAVRCLITPINWDGEIAVHASINGYAENQGFNHWELLAQEQTPDDSSEDFQLQPAIWLSARTRQSQIELGMAATLTLQGTEATFQLESAPGYPTLAASYQAAMGQTVLVEKMVTVYTSREVERPLEAARSKLATMPTYPACWQQHKQAWSAAWQTSDVIIEGDTQAQFAARYSVFQLLIGAPRQDRRVSIPAKTLSGFAYRGHIFWDTEIFMLPLFIFTQPELARHLLSYRYHTLEGARRKARSYGYKGAMFAWESADTGDEVTPRWALPSDPYASDIRIWCRDREIHISADIAYAIWQYWQATGDDDWMRDYGAEIVLDTAVFWMSRVEWNHQFERYELREVIGADEYHEHVNNNAFTNRMAQWHLEKAIAVYAWLQNTFPDRATALAQKLELTPERRQRWQDIAAHLWIPYRSDTGFIEQFEGFCNLEEIDLQAYEPRTQSMQTILGIDGANKRQVLKQPDVLMLLYLMRQLQEFPYSPDRLKTNWDYYAPRTDITYGSSLGPAIHAILAADLGDTQTAYQHFMQAALVDLENRRGNAAEGIHGACAGGAWQAIVFGFAGIRFQDRQPVATPHLPPHWTRLAFKLHWRGMWHPFDFTSGLIEANSAKPASQSPQMYETTSLPSKLTLRGAIFDLDGVLTDTAEYHYRAWQRLADEEGLAFDRVANEALRGISRRESLLKIVGIRPYTEAQLQEMMERKNRYYQEFIESITPADLLPGALSLLGELRQLGVKVAIASASKNARTVIEKLGIAAWIDAIADGYSVERPKPAPDLFLYAANQLRLPPSECVVLEDATAGIEAALAAGMWTVGNGPVERVGNAHVVLSSLASVSWADVVLKLNQCIIPEKIVS
ncbi:beta-phosphoglucomutase [cyanobacterium TDX16]|nr:beta-phosphoglucomutase [cyanobacterium TDX16]